ncbi:hypothetical protein ACFL3F_03955 [Planctomycetota bacterium]
MNTTIHCLAGMVLMVAGSVSAKPAPLLLNDGYLLTGAEGRILVVEDRRWQFELTKEALVGAQKITLGRRFPLLPCAALEAMLKVLTQRSESVFTIRARVTRYRSKNYLYVTYFVPIGGQVKQEGAVIAPPTLVPKESALDALGIPTDVLKKLQEHHVLEPRQEGERMVGDTDTLLLDRRARIVVQGDAVQLDLVSQGRNPKAATYRLLPCRTLEHTERVQAVQADPVYFRVVGIETQFQGESYLLLQRAVRLYGFGNF